MDQTPAPENSVRGVSTADAISETAANPACSGSTGFRAAKGGLAHSFHEYASTCPPSERVGVEQDWEANCSALEDYLSGGRSMPEPGVEHVFHDACPVSPDRPDPLPSESREPTSQVHARSFRARNSLAYTAPRDTKERRESECTYPRSQRGEKNALGAKLYRVGDWAEEQRAIIRSSVPARSGPLFNLLHGREAQPRPESCFTYYDRLSEKTRGAELPDGNPGPRRGEEAARRKTGHSDAEFRRLANIRPFYLLPEDMRQWEQRYKLLRVYVDLRGEMPEPDTVYCSVPIGRWYTRQLTLHFSGRMPALHRRMLGAVPGWDRDTDVPRWRENFQRLLRFTKRLGRMPCTDEVYGDFPIGAWCRRQRLLACKEGLDSGCRDMLRALPCWTRRPDEWGFNLGLLKTFVHMHKRLPGPADRVGPHHIGAWDSIQQAAYGRWLSLSRMKRLESVPGWWERQQRTQRALCASSPRPAESAKNAGGGGRADLTRRPCAPHQEPAGLPRNGGLPSGCRNGTGRCPPQICPDVSRDADPAERSKNLAEQASRAAKRPWLRYNAAWTTARRPFAPPAPFMCGRPPARAEERQAWTAHPVAAPGQQRAPVRYSPLGGSRAGAGLTEGARFTFSPREKYTPAPSAPLAQQVEGGVGSLPERSKPYGACCPACCPPDCALRCASGQPSG